MYVHKMLTTTQLFWENDVDVKRHVFLSDDDDTKATHTKQRKHKKYCKKCIYLSSFSGGMRR